MRRRPRRSPRPLRLPLRLAGEHSVADNTAYFGTSNFHAVGQRYSRGRQYSDLPFTYHDARSYVVINRGAGTVVYPGYTALGDTTGDVGVARPYKSTERNPDFNAQTDAPDMAVHFMNRRTFQIIAPGLDNSYGWDALAPVDSPAFGQVPCPVFKVFNTGEYFHPSGNAAVPTNYFNSHRDNLTNFSEGRTLEDSKP